ncbi:hypothetical protein KA005_72720, partial [bacterium]|nr:hypothetical protein [bacterium]
LIPGYSWRRLRVWSHRRILFQGATNFIESIFLFGVLYRYFGDVPNRPLDIYQASFDLATSLSLPDALKDCPRWLTNFQVLVSLFFLVVVISIIASAGYTRRELAPTDDNKEH